MALHVDCLRTLRGLRTAYGVPRPPKGSRREAERKKKKMTEAEQSQLQ